MAVRLQKQRRQRRGQGQRHESRNQSRDRDGEREWTVELAGDAWNEGGGYEHRGQHERDGDDGRADLVHGLVRRVPGRETLGDVALDVLDHDNGVVHHDADGEHHAEESQRIEREAERRHDSAGAHQRHRDGHDRDDRGAPGLQKY
jgi:hypothetical protein